MTKQTGVSIFVAGIGVGVATAVLMNDSRMRARLGKTLMSSPFGKAVKSSSKVITNRVSDALSDAEAGFRKGEQAIGDISSQVKSTIDFTATAAKKVVEKVAVTSKDAAHMAGDHLERTGKLLQTV